MCLAIPMQVVALKGGSDTLFDPQVALVESDGIRKEIRLEMADRIPEVGVWLRFWIAKAACQVNRSEMFRCLPQPRGHRAPG
jgi:hydrogenase maturation factor